MEADETTVVVPYIISKENGGKYDEHTLTLGLQMGMVYGVLGLDDTEAYSAYVYPELAEQLDLVALAEGFTMTESPCPVDDELVTFTFTRNYEGVPDHYVE